MPRSDSHRHAPLRGGCQQCKKASKRALLSVTLWGDLIYLAYGALILHINYCSNLFPDLQEWVWTPSNSTDGSGGFYQLITIGPDPRCSLDGPNSIQSKEWLAAGSLHIISAFFWVLASRSSLLKYGDPRLSVAAVWYIPDFANFLEAALYMKTATMYGSAQQDCVTPEGGDSDYLCSAYIFIHQLELIACIAECVSSVVYIGRWFFCERDGQHGPIILDLDFYASVSLAVGSIIYVVYNTQNVMDPISYGSNRLFESGDIVYLVNALLYVLADLRDVGFCKSASAPCQIDKDSEDESSNHEIEMPKIDNIFGASV